MNLVAAAVLVLWLQLFWALTPVWQNGEYYSYGWLVAPLAVAFAVRRWQVLRDARNGRLEPVADEIAKWWWLPLLGLLALLLPIRLVGMIDPGWRPPLILHAALVVLASHWLLWRYWGRKASLWFLPVTIFALSAVPYPWQIERAFVSHLTRSVMSLTHEIFVLGGEPVEREGDRLILGDEVCEVTDGCSGIRSFQSLVMAGLFFGELLWLSLGRRLLLLAVAGICAVLVNTARAWALAEIQFSRGLEAAKAAHDGIGHLAFVVSAVVLFGSAYLLQRGAAESKRRVVVRKTVKTPSSGSPDRNEA